MLKSWITHLFRGRPAGSNAAQPGPALPVGPVGTRPSVAAPAASLTTAREVPAVGTVFDRVLAAQPAPEIAEEPAPEEHDVAVLPKALDVDAQPEASVVAAAAEEAVEAAAAGESVEAAHLEESVEAAHPDEPGEAAHPDEPGEAAHPEEAELAAPAPSPAATARPDPGEYHDLARLAATTGDWPAAERCWRQFIAIEPRFWWAHCGLAAALREQGHIAEAEAVLLEQQPLLPDDTAIFADYARLAETRQDWREALARWDAVRERFPGQFVGYGGMVTALRALGRTDEVGPLLQDAERQLANVAVNPQQHVSMYHDLARLAEAKRDWSEAERCWRQFVAIEPRFWWADCGLAAALREQGQVDAAEETMTAAAARFPDEPAVAAEFARIAEYRGTWSDAFRRWQDAEARFPGQTDAVTRIYNIQLKMIDQQITLGGDDLSHMTWDDTSGADPSIREQHRSMMMTFESMGGLVTGCEFGSVQRAFGAEPLGLLRWASVTIPLVTEILERRFDRIGDPETTEIALFNMPPPREYAINDKTFRFGMHSHVYEGQQDVDSLWQQSCRRLQFLKRKMIDDLSRRDKIFLIKDTLRVPSEAEVDRLYAAMRAYGDNVLLIVVAADDANPHGTLKDLRDGLWLGYMDFSGTYDPNRVKRWFELCQVAFQRYQAFLQE
jgi:tetratricopeptide (TPR) repeat protein